MQRVLQGLGPVRGEDEEDRRLKLSVFGCHVQASDVS